MDIAIPQYSSDKSKIDACKIIQDAWDELTLKVIEEFKINGFSQKDVILRPGYRMQYMGQLNDLEITSPVSKAASVADWEEIVKEYEKTYARVYSESACSPELGFSVTGVIMRGVVATQKPVIPVEKEHGATPPKEAKIGVRKFYRHKKWVDADVWQMEKLLPGNEVIGPAIVESDATFRDTQRLCDKTRQTPIVPLERN